jgi:hypothetical protein
MSDEYGRIEAAASIHRLAEREPVHTRLVPRFRGSGPLNGLELVGPKLATSAARSRADHCFTSRHPPALGRAASRPPRPRTVRACGGPSAAGLAAGSRPRPGRRQASAQMLGQLAGGHRQHRSRNSSTSTPSPSARPRSWSEISASSAPSTACSTSWVRISERGERDTDRELQRQPSRHSATHRSG